MQLDAFEGPPDAASYLAVHLGEAPRRRHQQGKGMFGDAAVAVAGNVPHCYAEPLARRSIDVIADSGAEKNDAAHRVRVGLQQRRRQNRVAVQNPPIAPNDLRQLLRVRIAHVQIDAIRQLGRIRGHQIAHVLRTIDIEGMTGHERAPLLPCDIARRQSGESRLAGTYTCWRLAARIAQVLIPDHGADFRKDERRGVILSLSTDWIARIRYTSRRFAASAARVLRSSLLVLARGRSSSSQTWRGC